MKKVVLVLFFLSFFLSYGKQDTTLIKLKGIDNVDLRIIANLNETQFVKLICSDTSMRNEKFYFYFEHYVNGVITKTDSMGPCKKKDYTFFDGKDSILRVIDFCDNIKFPENRDSMIIRIAGKQIDSGYKFYISYPYLYFILKLKDSIDFKDFDIRYLKSSGYKNIKIPLNKKMPIFAFTNPFITSNNIADYCILDISEPKDWYKKFNIKNFYLFSLRIAD